MTAPLTLQRRSPFSAWPSLDGSSLFESRPPALEVGIVDLCLLERVGIKGAGTRAWVESTGASGLPTAVNTVCVSGSLATLCLGPEEFGWLALTPDGDEAVRQQTEHYRCSEVAGDLPGTMTRVPRFSANALVRVHGNGQTPLLARACSVDLSVTGMKAGAVVQTFAAGCAVVLFRHDGALYLLCDRSQACDLVESLIEIANGLRNL